MRKLSLLLLVAAAVCTALTDPRPASAQDGEPLIITQCDSVSIDGRQVQRIAFSLAASWHGFDNFQMYPVAPALGDTCRIVEASAPDGWTVSIEKGGFVFWSGNPNTPGATRDGFEVVLSGPSCCFHFFSCPVVLDPCSGGIVCFACPSKTDVPVPTAPRSWGSVKVQYR